MSRVLFILLYTLLLCCGCVREDSLGPYDNSKSLDISKLHPTGTLPVHLGKYDLRAHTKSNGSYLDTSMICIDSLIDFTSVRQVYFEDSKWLYDQFSLKSNKEGLYGALTKSHKDFKDSLVPIKCFFLKVSNTEKKQLSEYVVTMLPQLSYYQKNPDYDYITKPNFSGLILYSDKSGNLLRTEYLQNGEIRRYSLSPTSESYTKSPKTKSTVRKCKKCESDTLEPDGLCIACKEIELNTIYISPGGIDWDNFIRMQLYELAHSQGFIAPGGGGGGGFPDPEGPGGNIENTDTRVSVVCWGTGCFEALLAYRFLAKESVFSYTAPFRGSERTCWFKQWTPGNFVSSHQISITNNVITIQAVKENQTLNAFYTTNSSCDSIARFMQDGMLRTVVDTLYKFLSIQNGFYGNSPNELYSVLYNDIRGYSVGVGGHHNVIIPLNSTPQSGILPHQLIHHSHYHTSGCLSPSIQDLVTLCLFFYHDCAEGYIYKSTFSIIVDNSFVVIKMKDFLKFQSFFNKYLIDTTTSLWYKEQEKVLLGEFKEEFNKYINTSPQQYEQVRATKAILDTMGLTLFWGTKKSDTTNAIFLQWNNTDLFNATPIQLGCISSLSL